MTLHILTIHPFDPWGSKIGGIENFIRAMFRYSPSGVTHSLIGVSEDIETRPLHQWQTIPFHNIPINFLPILQDSNPNKRALIPLFFRFPLKLRNLHLPDKTDIIIFHRVEPCVMTKGHKKKSILFIHGNPREITGPDSEVKWKYVPWLYGIVEAKAVSKVDSIHVVSRSGVNHLQNTYPHHWNKFQFQPTGFDESVFHQKPKSGKDCRTFNLDPSFKYILFAGRLEQQKNPVLALESFFHLRLLVENVKLLIAGTGNLLENMKAICMESQFGEDVIFLGRLDSATLAQLMQCCDAFLMTSHFEGMPIAALEALACGLPVVTTDVGEAGLLVKNGINGHIVPTGHPGTIAEALASVLASVSQYGNDKIPVSESVQQYNYSAIMKQLYRQIQTNTHV